MKKVTLYLLLMSVGILLFVIKQHQLVNAMKYDAVEWIQSTIQPKNTSRNLDKKMPTENIQFLSLSKPPKPPTDNRLTYQINNPKALLSTLNLLNNQQIGGNIILADGVYQFNETIKVTADNISINSRSKNSAKVILDGAQISGQVANLFWIAGNHFSMKNITLQNANNHLIQLASEQGTTQPIFKNLILRDGKEQFIKVSYNKNAPNRFSTFGLVENCLFYNTKGIAEHYYTGGIDAHAIRHWTIKNNVFKGIASPSTHIAEHAIHLWNNSAFNLVEGNIIIDSDRGVGFGMGTPSHKNIIYSNYAGIIRNNFIYHSNNQHPYADAGITLENSPKTQVTNNRVFLVNDYPNAIEYRFSQTKNVTITKNQTNKRIMARNNAQAVNRNNHTKLTLAEFIIQLNQHIETNNIAIESLPRNELTGEF